MKRASHFTFFFILTISSTLGQSDQEQIENTLQDFIDGTTYNYPERIKDAFYPETSMFLYNGADSVWKVTSEEYASWYGRRKAGTRNDRESKITSIDIEGDVAFAKLEVIIPFFGNRYTDLMLLKKIEEKWKIVAKCTSAEPIPKTPQEMTPRPVKEVIMEGLKRPWSMVFFVRR